MSLKEKSFLTCNFFSRDENSVDVEICFLFDINIHLVKRNRGGEKKAVDFLISSDKKDYFNLFSL